MSRHEHEDLETAYGDGLDALVARVGLKRIVAHIKIGGQTFVANCETDVELRERAREYCKMRWGKA